MARQYYFLTGQKQQCKNSGWLGGWGCTCLTAKIWLLSAGHCWEVWTFRLIRSISRAVSGFTFAFKVWVTTGFRLSLGHYVYERPNKDRTVCVCVCGLNSLLFPQFILHILIYILHILAFSVEDIIMLSSLLRIFNKLQIFKKLVYIHTYMNSTES